MKRLFWLHDESLCVPRQANSGDLLVFCWHPAYFEQQGWSLKRLVFIYESLCSLPVSIYAGEPSELLQALKQQHPLSEILIQQPLDPLLTAQLENLSQAHAVTFYPAPSMLDDSHIKPSKRFYTYWQQVAQQLGQTSPQKTQFHRYHRNK